MMPVNGPISEIGKTLNCILQVHVASRFRRFAGEIVNLRWQIGAFLKNILDREVKLQY